MVEGEAYLVGSHTVSGTNPQFYFKTAAPLEDRSFQTVISIPFINTSPDNTILFRFSGKENDINFEALLHNNGVDRANGTAPTNSDFTNGTVKTVTEQIVWLRDYMFNEDYDTYWSLTITDEGLTAVDGTITELNIQRPKGAASFAICRFGFKRGRVGGL